ncbi:MAG TPA: MarR family transcriptional regulator [Polyangia bacterium]|nr:MarR family transcriptional regulator [Polyangia bacterium]
MAEREQSAYRLAKLIKKARRQVTNAIRAELEPIGVSMPVVQLMKLVISGGDLSQLECSQEIELEPGALCRLLGDLEAQKLVTRRRDPEDKRRVLVAATATGSTLLSRAQPRVLAGIDGMFSRLTRAEQGELCRLLEKLTRAAAAPKRKAPGRRPKELQA